MTCEQSRKQTQEDVDEARGYLPMLRDEKREGLSTSKLQGNAQVRQTDLFNRDARLGVVSKAVQHFGGHRLSVFGLQIRYDSNGSVTDGETLIVVIQRGRKKRRKKEKINAAAQDFERVSTHSHVSQQVASKRVAKSNVDASSGIVLTK